MIVTLLSDFGLADGYVGQMKGVLLAGCPSAALVDLTHLVPPQDVRSGAFQLWAAVGAFPAGTVHLAVVDPGVGTRRRAVAAQAKRGDCFVGPDNGLLLPAIERLGGLRRAVEIRPAHPPPSRTFHGRDVFAPAAAWLARGERLDRLGPALASLDRSADFPVPRAVAGGLSGEVLAADAFGNLVTNLPAARLPLRFDVRVGRRLIRGGPHESYAAVPRGEPLAIVGSSGLLELSVREGSAREALGARPGSRVSVRRR